LTEKNKNDNNNKKTKTIMRKKLLKFGFLLGAFLMGTTSVWAVDSATSGKTGGCDWSYDADSRTLTISPATSPETGFTVGVMKTYKDNNKTEANGAPWLFKTWTSEVEKVVLEEGVTVIGGACFDGCQTKQLILPSTLKTIHHCALRNCTQLEALNLPNGIENIYSYSLEQLNKIKCLVIPASVKKLANSFAEKAYQAKTIVFLGNKPDFYGGLANPYDTYDFSTNKEYTGYAKLSDENQTTMAVSGSKISANVYYPQGDATWTGIQVTGTAGSINQYSASGFCGTPTLQDVGWVLAGTSLTIYGVGAMLDWTDTNNSTSTAPWQANKSTITDVTILEGITNIGAGAFIYCTVLSNVVIPQTVTTIGLSAFKRCRALTSISLPNHLTSLGSWCFQESGLTSLTIPATVTTLGRASIIYKMASLTELIVLPSAVVLEGDNSLATEDGSHNENLRIYVPSGTLASFYNNNTADNGLWDCYGTGTSNCSHDSHFDTEITPSSVTYTSLDVTLSATSTTYTGSAITSITPSQVLANRKGTISAGGHTYTNVVLGAEDITNTSGAFTTAYTNNTTVGTATVTVTGQGAYSAATAGTATFTIHKKPVTLTAQAQTITYGGSITNTTAKVTPEGLVDGHSLTAITLTNGASSTNVDTYDNVISPTNATIKNGGTDVTNNYLITYQPGNLTIEPKTATLVWENTSLPYTGTPQAPTATVSNLQSGDIGQVAVTVSGKQTNADTYSGEKAAVASALTGAKASNYALPASATQEFTINKVTLNVAAKPQTITYGETPTGNGVNYSGFVGSDTSGSLGGSLDYDFKTTDNADGTDYSMDVANATGTFYIWPKGLTSDNYNIVYASNTLTVNPRPITITAPNETVDYSTSPYAVSVWTATVTSGSLVTGATESDYHSLTGTTLTVNDATGVQTQKTIMPSAAEIKKGGIEGNPNLAGNYDITYVPGTLTEQVNVPVASGWTTWYNHYDVDIALTHGGVAVSDLTDITSLAPYIVTNVDTQVATTETGYIQHATPYLLKYDGSAAGPLKLDVVYNQSPITGMDNRFKGCTSTFTATGDNIYVLQGDEFVWSHGGIPANKCYIDFGTGGGARYRSLGINTGDGTTSLIELNIEDMESGDWYDLQGRKLDSMPTKKGLYIMNGKKVVIK